MSDGLITGAVNLAAFGIIVLIRRLVHHEGLASFGLGSGARSWRLLLVGLAAGTLLFSIYAGAAIAFDLGAIDFAPSALSNTLLLLAGWGFGFAGVALFEEGLFRGYMLALLRRRFPAAVAIAGQAVLFGAFHLIAYQASPYLWLGALNVAVLGVVLAVLVLRTRSLMAAVGVHVAWDLVQTILLMRQLTGVSTLLNLRIGEGLWAGTVTPETGLIVSIVFAAFGAALAASRRPG